MSNYQKESTKPIYFDTNVFCDLAENRIPDAQNILLKLKAKVLHKKFTITPSIDGFAELTFVLTTHPAKYEHLRKIYSGLVDWDSALKPATHILDQDILSFAYSGKPTTPFIEPTNEFYWFVEDMKSGRRVFSNAKLQQVAHKSLSQRQIFLQNVLYPRSKKQLQQKVAKLKDSEADFEKEFLGFWQAGGIAEVIATDLANHHDGVLQKCQQQGISKLLELPTVRLCIGYILHSWFTQLVANAAAKPSDTIDFYHAICAGAVGNLVTEDRKLRQAIMHIPNHKTKAQTLSEFIYNL